MPRRIVLVPSPLLASDSWAATAAALGELGHDVTIATLEDGPAPLWQQHARSAAQAAEGASDYVLVAHSGAGAILPVIAAAVGQHPSAAIFVDAGLPLDLTTRLEQIGLDSPATAAQLRHLLDDGGTYPAWSDQDLADLIADRAQRQSLLAGVRPRDVAFFTEPIPVPAGWDSVAAGYVRLSAGYDVWARIASDRNWPVVHLDGGHFQIVIDPASVATAIDDVLRRLAPQQPAVTGSLDTLVFDQRNLIPVIVQQYDTGEVLMMAWMTPDTLAETLDIGQTVFWSRSRGERWHKGATSGNTQRVVEVVADCDGDVLLVKVDQGGHGVACHTGARTCFHVPLSAP